jgi:hypothetical protein
MRDSIERARNEFTRYAERENLRTMCRVENMNNEQLYVQHVENAPPMEEGREGHNGIPALKWYTAYTFFEE